MVEKGGDGKSVAHVSRVLDASQALEQSRDGQHQGGGGAGSLHSPW